MLLERPYRGKWRLPIILVSDVVSYDLVWKINRTILKNKLSFYTLYFVKLSVFSVMCASLALLNLLKKCRERCSSFWDNRSVNIKQWTEYESLWCICASTAKIHESSIYFFNALSASIKLYDYNWKIQKPSYLHIISF